MGFFEKLKNGLLKTRHAMFGGIANIFKHGIDDDTFDELEELLICADVGYESTEMILDKLRERIKEEKIKEPEDATRVLKEILVEMIGENTPLNLETTPSVILVIGVNGVGTPIKSAKY